MIRILHEGRDRIPTIPDIPDGTISDIVEAVREGGDAALAAYEKEFGGASMPFRIDAESIKQAYDTIPKDTLKALQNMEQALRISEEMLLNHMRQIPSPEGMTRTVSAIPSAGCYVPGGLARYPSTAVMAVTPAAVAGVDRIVVISPRMDPITMVAADLCGATELYKVGGAQGVAALAYGTESIQAVHRIVGPGGPVVAAAKKAVSYHVSVDMEAGPTELGVVADETANDIWLVNDIISQAEHGPDSFCFLLTTSKDQARRVAAAIQNRLRTIQRADLVRDSLYGRGFIMICRDKESMMDLAQQLAPEHLQVVTSEPATDALSVTSPGLILLGETPSAASDYMMGSNHILPTGGQGRLRGQLSVLDFVKVRTTLQAGADTMADILDDVGCITKSEGLSNHYEAVRSRVT